MRAESLATREPSPSPVVPASPVRVTILDSLMAHGCDGRQRGRRAKRRAASIENSAHGAGEPSGTRAPRFACVRRPDCVAVQRTRASAIVSVTPHHEPHHDPRLRNRPRPERSQLHAALAAVADRARRLRIPEAACGDPRRPPLQLGGNLRALAPARFGAQLAAASATATRSR